MKQTETIVSVEELSKSFASFKAVDDLSFTVKRGEVYGFLGQNGAGKSTTIRMLLTLITPTRGSIRLFGKDLRHERKSILQQTGAVIEKPDLYKYLSALDNLNFMARLSGIKYTAGQLLQQLERVGLKERAESKVKTFSQGMKQRLGIACALVHNPGLIILDEPTNGLDPQGIADMRNLILHLSKNEGKTLIVSSHLLSEIEMIADSMLIIDKGKKIVEGRVGTLLNPAHTLVELITLDQVATKELLQSSSWSKFLKNNDNDIILEMHQQEIPELMRFLVQQNVAVLSVSPKHSLEKYFLSLTTENQNVATYKH